MANLYDSVSPVKADGWLGASSGYATGRNNTAQDDDPSHPIGAYFAQMPAWQTMQAVLRGNQYLKQVSSDYIPRLPNEQDDCFKRRTDQALFTPYTSRVIDAAIGLIMRKPITLEGGDETFWEEWSKDCDRQGTDFQEFARKVLTSSIGYGHASIMVDYPKKTGIRTLADERQAKLMPYFTMVEPWQIIGWRQDRKKSGAQLEQVRIREFTTRPRGEFGEEVVENIRVLENGTFKVFERTQSDAKWMMVEAGRTSLKEIPLAITYSDKRATFISEPPLLDVAHINLAHYRLQSGHLNALQVAGFPLLVLKGWDDQSPKLQVDVSKAIAMPPEGDVSYVEPANSAFQAYMDELEALADQCSNLGIAVLQRQKMVAESGKKTALDHAQTNSMLANVSLDLEQALQKAVDMAANYAGIEAPKVGLSRDFDVEPLDGQGITSINTMFTSGLIDQETALNLLHRGEVLDDSVEIEEILSRAENEELHDMENQVKRAEMMQEVSPDEPMSDE
jgi:hypothetical protein